MPKQVCHWELTAGKQLSGWSAKWYKDSLENIKKCWIQLKALSKKAPVNWNSRHSHHHETIANFEQPVSQLWRTSTQSMGKLWQMGILSHVWMLGSACRKFVPPKMGYVMMQSVDSVVQSSCVYLCVLIFGFRRRLEVAVATSRVHTSAEAINQLKFA